MFNNLYEKIKKFIKEYYKNIIFFVVLYIIFMWPLNYYIIVGGGIMEVGNRIEVEDAYKAKGSFNLAYVGEAKGTVATYLLSYIMPDWKRVKISNYTYDELEDLEDVAFRGNIDLLNAHDNAIKNAYLKANKEYKINKTDFYIYYTDKDNKNDLQVGDKLLKIDGQDITDLNTLKTILTNHSKNDKVKLVIERDNKEKEVVATIYEKNNELILGIYVNAINNYTTNPKIKIKFKDSESGPSGGIIETLDIYNKLTKEDITHGLKIAGTGEIDSEGRVLAIGEVKYKLLGAVKEKADVFIVPNDQNYAECVKIKKQKKLKIKLIGVDNFEQALEALNNLEISKKNK